MFEATAFLQVTTNVIMGLNYANFDMLFLTMCTLTKDQFRVLGEDIKNFVFNALITYGVENEKVQVFMKNLSTDKESNSTEILKIIRSEDFKPYLEKELVRCIIQHKKLLRYCEMMKQFFGPILFPSVIFILFYVILIFYILLFVSIFFSVKFKTSYF